MISSFSDSLRDETTLQMSRSVNVIWGWGFGLTAGMVSEMGLASTQRHLVIESEYKHTVAMAGAGLVYTCIHLC